MKQALLTVPLKLLEAAINKALTFDTETKAKLHILHDKVIKIHINTIKQDVFLRFADSEVVLMATSDIEANVTLSCSIAKLLQLAAILNAGKPLPIATLDIDGDIEVLKKLNTIMKSFEFDWEGAMAYFTGDAIAGFATNKIQKIKKWLGSSKNSLQENVTDYLQQEKQILPTKYEVEEFINAVDDVRLAADRLEARFNLIMEDEDYKRRMHENI